jgi:ribosomal-protein-alanine N-acetyltransferase
LTRLSGRCNSLVEPDPREQYFALPANCGTFFAMLPDRFETARLILRPIAPDDAPAILKSYSQDLDVVRFLTWRPHQTAAETEAYIARCIAAPTGQSRTYVLTDRQHRTLLGAFDLRRPEPHRVDCGYVLAGAHWGRGLMTEALVEISAWALRQGGIWRVGAVCDVENLASARVMEKAGLQREGILHRWIIHPNRAPDPRDCFSYALVR